VHKVHVDSSLLRPCQWHVVNGLACHCWADVLHHGIDGITGLMKRIGHKEGVEFSCHHHAFPPMKGALWTWEALQRTLEVAAEYLDLLEIWVQIEGRDIDPNKGGDLIIRDGHVHIC
jgi:hypothetical protein